MHRVLDNAILKKKMSVTTSIIRPFENLFLHSIKTALTISAFGNIRIKF